MAAGRALVVGRGIELGAADAMLDDADHGVGGTMVLTGEAGIGKSTLLDEVADRARRRDHRVLVGRCLPIVALVYDGFVDAFRSLDATEAAALPPILGDRQRVDPDGLGSSFEATAQMLESLASPAPVLLALDDFHWAHPTTRQLFVWLSRRLANSRVTLLATVRTPDESPHRADDPEIDRQFAEWWRMPWVERVELRRFDRDELALQLASVLGERPGRERLRTVMERSGGNPLFAREVALADGARLPDRLRDVLAVTLDQLPESTTRLLRVCAVAGPRVHHRLVEQTAELDGSELADLLRPAVDAEVLLTDGSSTRYEFHHALFAETILAGMLPGEAGPIHALMAHALERDPSLATHGAAEIAHHWLGSGDHERALVACIAAAGDAEAVGAAESAHRLLTHALDTWDRVADPEEITGLTRCAVLHRAAWCAEWSGQNSLAQQHLRAAVDQHAGSDAELGGHYALLAEVAARGFPPADFGDLVARALDLTQIDPPSPDRARAHLAAGWYWDMRPGDTLEHAPEALSIAEAVDSPDLRCQAMVMLGGAMTVTGLTDAGIEMARQGQAVARSHGRDMTLLASHIPVAAMLLRSDRIDAGITTALDGLELARRRDGAHTTVPWLAALAMSGLVDAGRWDEAEGLITEVDGDGLGTSWLHFEYARLLAFRGERE
ncbi:MAG: AAA family ATPase, partial [Ilumatobacteraceae bacterium]